MVPLAYLAKRLLVNFDLFMEDEAAVPLLRSDEAQLISRELLYVMLDLDTEDAIEEDIAPLIEWILAAGPGEADAGRRGGGGARGRARPAAGVQSRWRRSSTRGFLLCAVVGDVSRRRVIKFAYDQPLARPGRSVHFYDTPGCTQAASYHAEVDVPDEMRARTTDMVDDLTGSGARPRPARHGPPGDPLRRRAGRERRARA